MSYWNHRVMRHTEPQSSGESYVYFAVHEVFYDDNDEVDCWTSDPVAAQGEDVDSLRLELQQMVEACEQPALDFNAKPKGTAW